MRRVRMGLFLLAATCASVAIWWRGRDVLLTDAEIAAAIPPDVRFREPSPAGAAAEAALDKLDLDVYARSAIESPWIVGDFKRNYARFRHVADYSDWVLDRLDRAVAPGLPEAPVDYSLQRRTGPRFANLYRVLSLRCDLKLVGGSRDGIGRDVVALARFLRASACRRCAAWQYDEEFFNRFALQTVHRVLDADVLRRDELRELLDALPTDDELVQAHQDRVRYDLETRVAAKLRPSRVTEILRPKRERQGDYGRSIVGRLDVPLTLRREVGAARGLIASAAAPRPDPRPQAAMKERYDVLGGVPWPKPGEAPFQHRLRELGFRMRMLVHPNPRGALVGIDEGAGLRDRRQRLDRAYFALVRARIQRRLKLPGPLPIDPWTGRPMRHDPGRRLVWCIGENRTDDGGTMSSTQWDVPDVVSAD